MAQETSSRRSHRTARISRKAQRALLGGSILLFVAGSGALWFAVSNARAQIVQEAPVPQVREQPATQARSWTPSEETADDAQATGDGLFEPEGESGALTSAKELDGSSASTEESGTDSPEAEEKASAKHENEASARKSEASGNRESGKTKKGGAAEEKKPSETTRTAPVSAQERPDAKEAKTRTKSTGTTKTARVHHTAYKKVTVYRTREHKATSGIEADGENAPAVQEACPICGKKHKHGFTERIFDHYEYHYCKACGKKHAKAYTETVAR